MVVRGIRGATRVKENRRDSILAAARDLLKEMVAANGIDPEMVASIFFTVTPDLNAEFPAYVTRELGWRTVPLLCAQEIAVPHGMSSMLRIMIHLNTDKGPEEIRHIYQGETKSLRPDLFEEDDQ